MEWTPLGLRAWTIGPVLRAPIGSPPPGVVEIWPCGDRLGIELQPHLEGNEAGLRASIEAWCLAQGQSATPKTVEIPVVYDGPDLNEVARALDLAPGRLVQLHSEAVYTCTSLGFCPGFAYLEQLPMELRGLPRRSSPRPRVAPGSVAIVNDRTAVYPLERPGGWHLIGSTSMRMVDVGAGYFPISVGDRVKFTPERRG